LWPQKSGKTFLEIACSITPRIELAVDERVQSTHAIIVRIAEFQGLQGIVHEYPHEFFCDYPNGASQFLDDHVPGEWNHLRNNPSTSGIGL
jgi:hypothetical protein